MKKLLFYFLLLNTVLRSQSLPQKGDVVFSFGFGFPNLYHKVLNDELQKRDRFAGQYNSYEHLYVTQDRTSFGPLFVKCSYAPNMKFSLGFSLSYFQLRARQTLESADGSKNHTSQLTAQNYSAGLRLDYHFIKTKKLDGYFGAIAGYGFLSGSYSRPGKHDMPYKPAGFLGIPLYAGLSGGIRYYISKNLGVYTEAGFDNWVLLQCGLAVKL